MWRLVSCLALASAGAVSPALADTCPTVDQVTQFPAGIRSVSGGAIHFTSEAFLTFEADGSSTVLTECNRNDWDLAAPIWAAECSDWPEYRVAAVALTALGCLELFERYPAEARSGSQAPPSAVRPVDFAALAITSSDILAFSAAVAALNPSIEDD